MFFKEDETLKYINADKILNEPLKETKLSGSFIIKSKNKKSKSIYIIFSIMITAFIILSIQNNSKISKIENTITGTWEAKIKSQNSMKLVFDENKLTINDRPQKLKYEINDDIVIAKHTIYGFATNITPSIKFKIIDKNTIESNDYGMKIVYERVE